MNKTAATRPANITNYLSPVQDLLKRNCDCGIQTPAGKECAGCAKKKTGLQRKLAIGTSNDPLEHEADRVAEQVMSAPLNSVVNATPPRIQRFSGQTSDGKNASPASIERVLASSGTPLEPAIQNDMGRRFGHDFSQVRVHTGGAAEQSARDVNANAYTVGNNVVFGAGKFAPSTHEGQRLIAHELTHVVQQAGLIQRDVNPEIAHLPATLFIDSFQEVHYSLDYRTTGGNLSTWLQVQYSDGTVIDVSIYDIVDRAVDSKSHIQMMENGRIGQGGRIFPQEMNTTTTPRLASAKRSAIETMEEYNFEFIKATIPAILFIITMPLGISRPTRPTRTTTRLPRVRIKTPTPQVPFNSSQIADELHTATQSLGNPGQMMLAAAKRLSAMRHLSAAQKVEVTLEFFRRIGFAIKGGVQETSEYFLMNAENGRYAFKFMKDTGQIIYGKFDMTILDFIWTSF